jgi:hypothetical protein
MSYDDLPELPGLMKLPFDEDEEATEPCEDGEDCRWFTAEARARALFYTAVESARGLVLTSEMLRAHGDHLIADVIEDCIMYLSNAIDPYVLAHTSQQEEEEL